MNEETELMAQAFIAGLVYPHALFWYSDLYPGCSRGCKYHACYIEDYDASARDYEWHEKNMRERSK